MEEDVLMNHDKILTRMNIVGDTSIDTALRAVIGLHSGEGISNRCTSCANGNKCETILVIEKELI
jgi:hypothetical protein